MENFTIEYGKNNSESITSKDIMNEIQKACYNHGLENGLQDLHECKSGQFSNILSDVGSSFFKPLKILHKDPRYINNNYMEYDKDKLYLLLKLYLYLCIEYDKAMYLQDYYAFCGLNERYFHGQVSADNETLKTFSHYARKIIDDTDNERMGKRASDSKQALLNMGYVNYRHNWNGQIKQQELQTTAKTLNEIRQQYITTDNNSPI